MTRRTLSWQCKRAGLTNRQANIVSLMANGFTDRKIALSLGISIPTVRTHYNRMAGRFDASGRTHLVHLIWDWEPTK